MQQVNKTNSKDTKQIMCRILDGKLVTKDPALASSTCPDAFKQA